MSQALTQAWQYLRFYPWRTLLIVISVGLCLSVPMGIQQLVNDYETQLTARANSTPLILGAVGDRYDLTMNALYFRAMEGSSLRQSDLNTINKLDLALAIPLNVRYSASDYPLVGTSLDYFDLRGHKLTSGSSLAFIGDVVLGTHAARALNLSVGDTILSDQKDLYNLASTYPIKLNIVGILAPTGTPDDQAIFCDTKTTWVIAGLGHGHDAIEYKDTLKTEGSHTVASAALKTHVTINESNRHSFHFHGDASHFPLTSIIVSPPSPKQQALLRARYDSDKTVLIDPRDVMDEIMGVVLRIENFTQQAVAIVVLSMVLLLGLLIAIISRLRSEETRTLAHIGFSRVHILMIFTCEWFIMLVLGALLANILVGAVLPQLSTEWLHG